MRISVRVKPGSKSGDRVVANDPYLDVFLKEKPIDGKANEALVRLLREHFGTAPDGVRIISGFGSRIKIVEIGGPEGT
ncbi:DUF167 domain-containing protein [Aquiluna sp. KACHI24]|uniref:DUF167 domain-containing protein n=1 Tax=Aquiluna sp. KACHI24 TaxID=2968831 RepID=UPI002201A8BA|nr:DUF167 domain-containing protein [Aquiluna sp. KACHI24]BDQ00422.1 UPF0235 protein [Aquiluna sp. KACHI24]